MDGRRSYLDSLNAGRPRRPQNTLDELNRSLERLGERLERRDDQTRGGFGREQERPRAAELPSQRSAQEMPRPAMRPERDVAAPRDDAYMATTGRLAAEVKGLREELRQQMTFGLQHEFENLRADISRAYAASASSGGKSSGKLAEELERITDSIQLLSERSDDRGVNMLRLDIEQVRAEIESLAREETLRSMDSRWDHFDRRWDDLEHRIDSRAKQDPGLSALNDRLQQITDAVNNLPESLSLKSLEDKVRTLAGSVDQFSRQQDDRTPQFFGVVEQRLDEISRAIVASAVAAQPMPFDFEPIERIENRISALAYQLDELSNRGASSEIMERLNALSMRIDEVAQQADVPAKSVERLAGQIALIVDKIDAGSTLPNADEIMRGIESRFDQFAHALERRQDSALENSQVMFRDLEARLYDAVSRLDQRPEAPATDNSGIMEAIDARFDDFSRRLEARKADLLDRNSMRDLEAKIDTISSRIDNAPSSLNIDADAIRKLESQVAGLSAHLSKPDQTAPIMDSLSPRLEQMEKAIHGNRDMVIDAARRAAEDVVRSFAGSNAADTAAVAGLTQDLKALEQMSRRSDDRNAKTFEAIHDTLLKIVDRLGSVESLGAAVPAKVAISQAPSIETAEPADDTIDAPAVAPAMRMPKVEEFGPRLDTQAERSPVKKILESAVASVEAPAPEAAKKRSMFSGIGRAFSGKKATAPAAPPVIAPKAEDAAPKLDLNEPLDPKASNRPLQPGSGAPDLSRIMKRVREERAQQPAKVEEADTGKSDFIAAARRAAQAAAAEAEVLKRHADIAGPGGGFKLGELLKTRRKPILMGATAIMIALAALQLSKALFADHAPVAARANLATSPIDTSSPPVAADAVGATEENDGAKSADAAAAQRADSREVRPAEQTRDAEETASAPAAMPQDMPMEPAGTQADTAAEPETPATASTTPDATGTVTASVAPVAAQAETPAATAISVPDDAGPIVLREAAEAGDPAALFEIGARYSDGRGAKADNKKAAEWYERAAEAGLAPAQYRIGNMYEKGVGVERDLKKAKTWYQMAAEQGNASAMHNLAVLYAMGADGTADNDSAARWFTQAGELGVKDSQFNLGILNAKGIGMPQNLEESYKWFALVAKTGDRDAAAKRDEIANSLRPEQLEKARATTELWKPKPVDPASNLVDIPDAWKEGQEKTASVDMQKAVKTIQLILNKNGYDAGGADGVMGAKTKTAIMAFQKDNGMPANGEVTEKLVQELLARK